MFHSSAVIPVERLDQTGLLPTICHSFKCYFTVASCGGIGDSGLETRGSVTAVLLFECHVALFKLVLSPSGEKVRGESKVCVQNLTGFDWK